MALRREMPKNWGRIVHNAEGVAQIDPTVKHITLEPVESLENRHEL